MLGQLHFGYGPFLTTHPHEKNKRSLHFRPKNKYFEPKKSINNKQANIK